MGRSLPAAGWAGSSVSLHPGGRGLSMAEDGHWGLTQGNCNTALQWRPEAEQAQSREGALYSASLDMIYSIQG